MYIQTSTHICIHKNHKVKHTYACTYIDINKYIYVRTYVYTARTITHKYKQKDKNTNVDNTYTYVHKNVHRHTHTQDYVMYPRKSRLSSKTRVVLGLPGAQFVMSFSEHVYVEVTSL